MLKIVCAVFKGISFIILKGASFFFFNWWRRSHPNECDRSFDQVLTHSLRGSAQIYTTSRAAPSSYIYLRFSEQVSYGLWEQKFDLKLEFLQIFVRIPPRGEVFFPWSLFKLWELPNKIYVGFVFAASARSARGTPLWCPAAALRNRPLSDLLHFRFLFTHHENPRHRDNHQHHHHPPW